MVRCMVRAGGSFGNSLLVFIGMTEMPRALVLIVKVCYRPGIAFAIRIGAVVFLALVKCGPGALPIRVGLLMTGYVTLM